MGNALSVEEGPVLLGRDAPVNAGARDLLDLSAHNSPALARNPADAANLALVNRIDSPTFSCGLHVSSDGGTRWTPRPLPTPEGEEPKCFAPDAAFGADGTLYVAFLTLQGQANVPHALWLTQSSDGGRTLSVPTKVLGPLAFQVRLVADPTTPRRLYLSWLQAEATANLAFPETGYPIQLARSDDGGASWSSPARVSPASRLRVVAPVPAVASDGELYVLYLDVGDDRLDYHGGHGGNGGEPYPGRWELVLARSEDQGDNWTEEVVDDGIVPTQRFVAFLPPSPSLALDGQRGRLYVGFHDGRAGDADVWVWASHDRGATFAPPSRANDTPPGDGTSQYLPQLSVAPNGRLDVVYYDRRADSTDVMTEASLQSSTDGGRHFGPRVRLSDIVFDSRIGFGSERDLADLGSRLALVSTDRRSMAVWTDTRAGTVVSGKQDLYRAVVATQTAGVSPAARNAVRLGGLAIAAVGLVVFASAMVPLLTRRSVPEQAVRHP